MRILEFLWNWPQTNGLDYTHITIVNDDTSVVNKFEASLTDDARVIIYDRHMLIVQTKSEEDYSRSPFLWLAPGFVHLH
jgi:hypothetical protein